MRTSALVAVPALTLVLAGKLIAPPLATRSSSTAPTTPRRSRRRSPASRGVVPPVRVEDGRVVLPLTFPDGTTAALASARELAIAELGVLVGGSGRLDGCRACAFDDATLGLGMRDGGGPLR